MSNGTKIALAVMAVLMLLCGVGLYSLFSNATSRLAEARAQAKPTGDEILILLTESWEFEAIELRAADELTDRRSEAEVQEEMNEWRQELGTLVSSEGEVTSSSIDLDGEADRGLVAIYTADAEFEKGRAEVVLTLTRKPGEEWMLADFQVLPAD